MKKVFYRPARTKTDPFGHWTEVPNEYIILGITDGENSFVGHEYIETEEDFKTTENLKVEKVVTGTGKKEKMELKITKFALSEEE